MRPIGGEHELQLGELSLEARDEPAAPASGRGALAQILGTLGEGMRVLLPDYLCESVVHTVMRLPRPFGFYRLRDGLYPDEDDLDRAIGAGEPVRTVVVVVSYFGLVALGQAVARMKARHPDVRVIKDDVHAPHDVANLDGADFAFTSYRKSLPVPDGARIEPPLALPLSGAPTPFHAYKALGAIVRAEVLAHGGDERLYLQLLQAGEAALDGFSEPSKGSAPPAQGPLGTASGPQRVDPAPLDLAMSPLARACLRAVDFTRVASQRRENFRLLAEAIAPLGLQPLVPLALGAVPLALPVRVRGRDRLRAQLAERRMFCPVHWPAPSGLERGSAERLYREELSLVIDQRYGAPEMERLAEALRRLGAQQV
jgi:hypothetical protein